MELRGGSHNPTRAGPTCPLGSFPKANATNFNLLSLRRFKDDVREVLTGYECGIGLENFQDIHPGDVIEAFELVQVLRRLAPREQHNETRLSA